MNKTEFLAFHKEMCDKMHNTTKAKNADYTGNSDSPFANFNLCESIGITTTERGMLVRMSDKISRVLSFLKQGVLQVKDETVEDSLIDMANYCIIMAAYIKSKRNEFVNPLPKE